MILAAKDSKMNSVYFQPHKSRENGRDRINACAISRCTAFPMEAKMPEVKEILDDNRKIVEFKSGEVVIQEGTMADGLYVLMNGKVEVSVKGTKIASIATKGAFLGEIASLLRCRRIATVVASETSKFLFIENITRHFEEHTSSALTIAQTLASRIMDMNQKIIYYQKEIESWIKKGKDALVGNDAATLQNLLLDMQKILVDERVHKEKA